MKLLTEAALAAEIDSYLSQDLNRNRKNGYNPKRRHSYLEYISPNEFEKRYNLEASKNLGVN